MIRGAVPRASVRKAEARRSRQILLLRLRAHNDLRPSICLHRMSVAEIAPPEWLRWLRLRCCQKNAAARQRLAAEAPAEKKCRAQQRRESPEIPKLTLGPRNARPV